MSNLTAKPAARILPNLKQAMPTQEQLLQMIAELQAQNAALAAAKPKRGVAFKVSEKGCVTITGIGTYGMTVYASQWAQVLDNAPALARFIHDNAGKLSFKTETDKATALASCATYLED